MAFPVRNIWLVPVLLLLILAGCATTEEGADGEKKHRPRPEDRLQRAERPMLSLAQPDSSVKTIQLHRRGIEQSVPVLSMGSGDQLQLAFDLLGRRGRPLTVYFYHANQTWVRDLSPIEYMTGFAHDNLLDYQVSGPTEVAYVHYRYAFPTNGIDFKLSGNYILRVTEQGDEQAVLFERPFFVAEQSTPVDLGLQRVMVAGQGFAAVQPTVAFTPPEDLRGNIFAYNVCFIRNGRIDEQRCVDQPSLNQQPSLLYFLEPRAAYAPIGAAYFLDLSNLRVGSRIARTNIGTNPDEVLLEPDYARFAGSGAEPLLAGQIVLRSDWTSTIDPEVNAEYVDVRFAYVPPDEQRLPGEVLLYGSFNGWRLETATSLAWVEEAGRYEGRLLLKQGQYEYRYYLTDRATRNALQNRLPRPDNLYQAFIYFEDVRYQTDRLIAVNGTLSQ